MAYENTRVSGGGGGGACPPMHSCLNASRPLFHDTVSTVGLFPDNVVVFGELTTRELYCSVKLSEHLKKWRLRTVCKLRKEFWKTYQFGSNIECVIKLVFPIAHGILHGLEQFIVW